MRDLLRLSLTLKLACSSPRPWKVSPLSPFFITAVCWPCRLGLKSCIPKSGCCRTKEVVASTFFFFEYFLRVFVHRKRCWAYSTSFLGVIDFLVCIAAVPTLYQKFIAQARYNFQNSHTFHVLSCFRMLRVLKLLKFVREYQALTLALRQELRMIVIFLFAVWTVVLILGTCLYAAERFGNPDSPFDSIPAGMWWAAVTITTVGYGDLVPQTWLGKLFASMSMLLGYGLLAVPTIVGTLEINQLSKVRDRDTTLHSSYFKPPEAPDLQEPLLGDDDMVQFRARAHDFNSRGLKLSAGYSLLEEVICLWMEKRFQKGIDSCGAAIEHRFCLLQPFPLPSGRQLLAKVEVEDIEAGLGLERNFLISIFVADIETCKVAEGYIRYEVQSTKFYNRFWKRIEPNRT